MRDRVRPPAELEWVLDLLKEQGVFATKQKGMMFAGALGYRLQRLETPAPLESTGEGIRLEYFQKPRDDGFLDALAVAQNRSLRVLEETALESRLELFETYAEMGLKRIELALQSKGRDALPAVLELLELYGFDSSDSKALPGLGGLVDRVAEQL